MRPIEVLIPERPVSQQARRRDRVREWKSFVAEHARAAADLPTTPLNHAVSINYLFLYDDAALDIDNIVKPIQDALVGIILEDDKYVTDVIVRKRWLKSTFSLTGVSPTLASGFGLGREFVYVLVADAPAQDVLI